MKGNVTGRLLSIDANNPDAKTVFNSWPCAAAESGFAHLTPSRTKSQIAAQKMRDQPEGEENGE